MKAEELKAFSSRLMKVLNDARDWCVESRHDRPYPKWVTSLRTATIVVGQHRQELEAAEKEELCSRCHRPAEMAHSDCPRHTDAECNTLCGNCFREAAPSTEAQPDGPGICDRCHNTCGGGYKRGDRWLCLACDGIAEREGTSNTEAPTEKAYSEDRDKLDKLETAFGKLKADFQTIGADFQLQGRVYDDLYTSERDRRREQIAEHTKRLATLENKRCPYTDRPHVIRKEKQVGSPVDDSGVRVDNPDEAELEAALRGLVDKVGMMGPAGELHKMWFQGYEVLKKRTIACRDAERETPEPCSGSA